MEVRIYGYDSRGNFIHILSGDSDLVLLSKRKEYKYTDQPYPDDGNEYIYNNGWILKN